jgi:hypothetical protein
MRCHSVIRLGYSYSLFKDEIALFKRTHVEAAMYHYRAASMEDIGIEPMTYGLQSRRSPS